MNPESRLVVITRSPDGLRRSDQRAWGATMIPPPIVSSRSRQRSPLVGPIGVLVATLLFVFARFGKPEPGPFSTLGWPVHGWHCR